MPLLLDCIELKIVACAGAFLPFNIWRWGALCFLVQLVCVGAARFEAPLSQKPPSAHLERVALTCYYVCLGVIRNAIAFTDCCLRLLLCLQSLCFYMAASEREVSLNERGLRKGACFGHGFASLNV